MEDKEVETIKKIIKTKERQRSVNKVNAENEDGFLENVEGWLEMEWTNKMVVLDREQ